MPRVTGEEERAAGLGGGEAGEKEGRVKEDTKKCRRFSATTERRPILIPELLPFYFNFLAFKPSKRVYLRNIIAEDRRESTGWSGRIPRRKRKRAREKERDK
jgi:hypothetical protein